jgi:hypothetical protein
VIQPQIFEGAWYGDATLTDEIVLFPGSHFHTSRGRVELPIVDGVRQNVLQPRLAHDGERFAGTLHEGRLKDHAWEWDGTEWHNRGGAYAVDACIYNRHDQLVVNQEILGIGVQGWRQVDDNGQLVPGQFTYHDPVRKIHEFTTRGNITIGTSGKGPHGEDAVIALYNNKRYVLFEGENRFVRFRRYGEMLVIIFTINGRGVGLFRFNERDLVTFPEQRFVADPPKVEIPKEEPKVPEIPERLQNRVADVAQIRYDGPNPYPTPLGDRHGEFMIELAQFFGAKLYRDDIDIFIPELGVKVSQDIIIFEAERVWVDVLGDAETLAIPTWAPHAKAENPDRFVDVSHLGKPKPEPPKEEPKDEEPKPTPAPSPCDCESKLGDAIAPLFLLVTQLVDTVATVNERLASNAASVADIKRQLEKGFTGSGKLGMSVTLDIKPKG